MKYTRGNFYNKEHTLSDDNKHQDLDLATRLALARLDERVKSIIVTLDNFRLEFKDFKSFFVTKDEFRPVKAIVFGFVGLALTLIITLIIMSVTK